MEFKKLEIKPEGSWFKRMLHSQHMKKTAIAVVLGAIAGFLYFYYGQGQHMEQMPSGEVLRSVLTGAFFGWFITNSPCARGKC